MRFVPRVLQSAPAFHSALLVVISHVIRPFLLSSARSFLLLNAILIGHFCELLVLTAIRHLMHSNFPTPWLAYFVRHSNPFLL